MRNKHTALNTRRARCLSLIHLLQHILQLLYPPLLPNWGYRAVSFRDTKRSEMNRATPHKRTNSAPVPLVANNAARYPTSNTYIRATRGNR